MPAKKKMGRPIIGKPKSIRLEITLDEDTNEKLNNLCKKENISRAELIRRLIKKAK